MKKSNKKGYVASLADKDANFWDEEDNQLLNYRTIEDEEVHRLSQTGEKYRQPQLFRPSGFSV